MGETVRRASGWLLLIVLSLLSVGLAAGAGADELIGSRRMATVQIQSFTCDGVAGGTGVIVDGDVVTNRHVVAGAHTVQVTLANGETLTSSTVATSATTDVAVVQLLDAPAGVDFAPSQPGVGEDLVIAGHPGSMELTEQPTVVDGVYATGLSGDPSIIVRAETLVVAGHSGSPAFNDAGDVAAIVYASEHGSQQALMIGAAEVRAAIADTELQQPARCG